MKEYLEKYFFVLGAKRKKLPLVVCFFILASALDLIGLGLVGPFIAIVMSPEQISEQFIWIDNIMQAYSLEHSEFVIMLGSILLLVFYIKGFTGYFVHKFIVRFSFIHQAEIIKLLMANYQAMPYENIIDRNTSSLLNTVSGHVRIYTEQTLMSSLKLTSELLVVIAVTTLLAITNLIAMLMLGVLFLTVFFLYDNFAKLPLQKSGKITAKALETILQGLKESMGSMKEVRVFGKQDFFFTRVADAAENYAEYGSKTQAMQNIPKYLLESTVLTFLIVLAGYTMFYNLSTANAIATLGVFAVASVRLLPSVFQISVAVSNLRFSRHHLNELYNDLKDLDQPIRKNIISEQSNTGSYDANKSFIQLELKDVSYKYPKSDVNAIQNVDITICKGECVAVIGKSGAGKTTFVDLILGLLTPTKGDILLNGINLSECTDFWYSTVAYIPQTVFLIDDTVSNNIALCKKKEDIDEDKLQSVIVATQLDDVIKNLPLGVNTFVGENGIKFSGGQRQRVALARALYHQREVIVLDEATSALDIETEKQIIKEINQLKGHKTIFVIAHRLETIKHCDRVIEIKNGIINDRKLCGDEVNVV